MEAPTGTLEYLRAFPNTPAGLVMFNTRLNFSDSRSETINARSIEGNDRPEAFGDIRLAQSRRTRAFQNCNGQACGAVRRYRAC